MAASMKLTRVGIEAMLSCASRVSAALGCGLQQNRHINKHYNPQFKRERREKFLKVDLPDFDRVHRYLRQEMTPAEIRAFMKRQGLIPYRKDAPIITLSDSATVIDPYIPKEGDGVASSITERSKDTGVSIAKSGTRMRAVRNIRKFEEDFDIAQFTDIAQTIYTEAHELLSKVFPRNFLSEYKDDTDLYRLHDLVTETGWPQMTSGLSNKTLVWKFVESIEAPRVVHVVCQDAKRSDNKYGQVTVRMHTKQILALYDRFGRLIYGSQTVPRDVLDFIVFEKHLSDIYGKWRIHGRIIPNWKQPSYDMKRTVSLGEPTKLIEETNEVVSEKV